MFTINTCTPKDIAEYSLEDVLKLANTLSNVDAEKKIPMKVRHMIIDKMYSYFGYQMSNDLLLALLANVKQQLILAPAGGCKTTSSQTKLILSKIFWNKVYGKHLTTNECLCLVYNAENRSQMDVKHIELLTPLVTNKFVTYDVNSPSYVNPGVKSHTLHSFCNYWINQYLDYMKLTGFKMITDVQLTSFFTTAINKVKLKDTKTKRRGDTSADRFQTLYDLVAGLKLSYDDILNSHVALNETVQSCNMDPADIVDVFKLYDNTKLFFKKYDFTDMLMYMDTLLDDSEIRQRMYAIYSYIIVDEIQDFTPLMMSILTKIVGPETRLLAIGDEDQSIYGFRGADVNNAVRFTEHFPESKVFQLVVNRRCGENILAVADEVVSMNKNRYDKKLIATRSGGTVDFQSYQDEKEQLQHITDAISTYTTEERRDSVVCVREKVYGQPISYALFKMGIPFYTLNASRFDRHEAFRGFLDIMSLIAFSRREHWKYFYKCINVKKEEWHNYIGYDAKKDVVSNFLDVEKLWDLDFEPFVNYKGFMECVSTLKDIHSKINTYPVTDYFDYIVKLFKQHFWEYRASMLSLSINEQVFDWLEDLFKKEMPFTFIYTAYKEKLLEYDIMQKTKNGVAVATFHALKGLEYKHVHIAYLEEAIFPSFISIESREYPVHIEQSLKEAENRLAYVAFTRAKDNLILHYAHYDPSFYVSKLIASKAKGSNVTKEDTKKMVVFSNKKVW